MKFDHRGELTRELPLRTGIRAAWLGFLAIAIGSNVAGIRGNHLPGAILVAAAFIAAANVVYVRPVALWFRLASVLLLGILGGLSGLVTPWAPIYLGIAGASSGTWIETRIAVVICTVGPATLAIATAADGKGSSLALGGAAAAFAGLVLGISRRQGAERSAQSAAMAMERDQTAVALERAELLDERNRIAREVHDVLAHTLGALSVQLEAADAILSADLGASDDVRAAIRRSRSLVVDGLGEARAAVRALRDAPVDLAERASQLAKDVGVEFALHGVPRTLSPAAGVALFRAAQEGVTNARRHAPGAPVGVEVSFGLDHATVRVTNGRATSPGPSGPPGYGLQGMRERVELAGGTLSAGPSEDGWVVEVTVPG